MVHRYCRARLGRLPAGQHAADDVAQEVCIAVLSALPRYEDRGRPFEAFVFGIAAHKVADAQRQAMRAPVPTDQLPDTVDDRPGPADQVVKADEAAMARDAAAAIGASCLVHRASPPWASRGGDRRMLGMTPGAASGSLSASGRLARLRILAEEVET